MRSLCNCSSAKTGSTADLALDSKNESLHESVTSPINSGCDHNCIVCESWTHLAQWQHMTFMITMWLVSWMCLKLRVRRGQPKGFHWWWMRIWRCGFCCFLLKEACNYFWSSVLFSELTVVRLLPITAADCWFTLIERIWRIRLKMQNV